MASSPRGTGSTRLRREDDSVREHRSRDGLDVLGHDVVASVRDGSRLRHAEERYARSRARPERQKRAVTRVSEKRDDVAPDALLDVDGACRVDRTEQVVAIGDRLELVERRARRLLGEHPRLLAVRRVAEREASREPVELRLGQRVRPSYSIGFCVATTKNGSSSS
jgi:hypothetical protein